MKKALLLGLVIGLITAGCGPSIDSKQDPRLLREPIADGRWLMINYWAIWCHPCREEIPELNDFAASRAADVALYAVNFDGEQGQQLLVQANELAIDFPLLSQDPAGALGYSRPTVLPTTIIIDPAGKVVNRLLGPQSEKSLSRALEEAGNASH